MVHKDVEISKVEKALENFPSLQQRNLDVKTMVEEYGVKTSPNGSIVIPLYSPTGLHVGDIYRTLSGNPKYRYMPEEANGYLYNYHRRPPKPLEYVIIQESPFDVYALHPIYSVALVGLKLDPLKLFCIEQMKAKVHIVALDTDGPGQAASYDIAMKLIKYGLSTIIYTKGLEIKEDLQQVMEQGNKLKPGNLWII